MPLPENPVSANLLLNQVFGFSAFRANQEAVCQAAAAGNDVLLVMPTGAGKSLCYQLPALARGGTALVISPLIALMDDQAAKLAALGLKVARIHSGLDRAASRQACVEYLEGKLQFLFIAPERLKVPGFPEMLAKRKPTLIAIDEAHCISQWGHDFRPDYRMLGQYLPLLRPAPVIALTATATPAVQDDIVAQLGLVGARRFIHGFRRPNLAIEVVEVGLPQRPEIAADVLRNPARRPAIVYAPTRKHAESLAARLAQEFPAAAYHAGLEPLMRESVQTRFLAGELDVVVATIAFGMGIDKADVRAVLHTALPATLEGYYQEIGRAGRDGRPCRAILMHSFADQRTQDFFLKRDYPPIDTMTKVYRSLTAHPQPGNELRAILGLDEESFQKAIEKLYIHGGAEVDYAGNASKGHAKWKNTYATQFDQRRKQIDRVLRYVDTAQCRMAALVRHFGDIQDARQRCGICDVCHPEACVVQQFRPATEGEQRMMLAVVAELRSGQGRSTGKLHKELGSQARHGAGMERDEFEALLGAMARAGILDIENAEFEAEDRKIAYRRVTLAEYGYEATSDDLAKIAIPEISANGGPSRDHGTGQSRDKRKNLSREQTDAGAKPPVASRSQKPQAEREQASALRPEDRIFEEKLKEWRQAEAKRLGVPPFLILHDRTLREIAGRRPIHPNQLLEIDGIGPTKAEKFGRQILDLCSSSTIAQSATPPVALAAPDRQRPGRQL